MFNSVGSCSMQPSCCVTVISDPHPKAGGVLYSIKQALKPRCVLVGQQDLADDAATTRIIF